MFFGYILENGIYLAEPEKAILDQLYMIGKGKTVSDTTEWSLIDIDRTKFLKYAQKFPKKVQSQAKKLISRLEKYVVTLEEKETKSY